MSSAAAGVYNYTFGRQGALSNIVSGTFTQTTTNILTGGPIGLYTENAAAGAYTFDNFSVLVGQSTGAVQVTSTEVWDGVANPHAVDGVILTGLGTTASPAVYVIPKGLNIAGTGRILINTTTETNGNSIRFNITGGDLTMAAGAVIDTSRHNREGNNPNFILDLGGTNSIVGAGSIVGLTNHTDSPRNLTITNVNNVSLANIDGHSEAVNSGIRTILIQANGAVVIPTVDNGDRDMGGGDTGNVTIKAASITVSNIYNAPWRAIGTPSAGKVILQALSPAGGYSPSAAANNTYLNKLIINGAVTTKGSSVTLGGNITNQAVVVKLSPAFTNWQPATAAYSLQAGTVQSPVTAADLFINQAAGNTNTAVYDVLWTASGITSTTTTTDLSSSANPSLSGGLVTFTAVVTTTGGVPTDTVTFRDGGITLGTAALGAGGGNTNTATFSLSTLTTGSHSITATYDGDASYLASVSSTVSQVVNPVSFNVDFSASGGDLTLSWAGTGYTVQQSTNLMDVNAWVDVPGPEGTNSPFIAPMTNPVPTFFRLKL